MANVIKLRVEVNSDQLVIVSVEEREGDEHWQPDYYILVKDPDEHYWKSRMCRRIYFTYHLEEFTRCAIENIDTHPLYNWPLDLVSSFEMIARLEQHPPSRRYHEYWAGRTKRILGLDTKSKGGSPMSGAPACYDVHQGYHVRWDEDMSYVARLLMVHLIHGGYIPLPQEMFRHLLTFLAKDPIVLLQE